MKGDNKKIYRLYVMCKGYVLWYYKVMSLKKPLNDQQCTEKQFYISFIMLALRTKEKQWMYHLYSLSCL